MNVGIILGAGHGERFGNEIPKQFCMLNNKKVIDYSISVFENSENIDQLIIVVPQKWVKKIQSENKKHIVIPGGANRKDSSYLGLKKCPENTQNVLIHDSARPFVQTELIDSCIANLINHDAVIVSLKATDTIMKVSNNMIVNIEDRDTLFLNQTPQGFKYHIILDAHKNMKTMKTDDISLINLNENKCMILEGSSYNIKITNPEDLRLAESIIKTNK